MKSSLKTFATAALAALLVLGAYHISVGLSVLNAYQGMGQAKFLTNAQQREMVLNWPTHLTATEVMSGRWVELMEGIGKTLEYVSTYKWEKVGVNESAEEE